MTTRSSEALSAQARAALHRYFGGLPEPRQSWKIEFPLLSIVSIAVLAALCGLFEWDEIAVWAKKRRDWLATFLDLPEDGRTPCESTFARVFARLRADAFRDAFMAWAQALAGAMPERHIALDGKALRRAFRLAAERSKVYLVSAFATDNHLVLGQVRVEEKSNEITALPALLALLDLRGAIVSIDAAGAQVAIASQIVDGGGDYNLALKGNQSTTHQEVGQFLLDADALKFTTVEHRTHQSEDVGHGREERRRVVAVECPEEVPSLEKWKGVKSIVLVERERIVGSTSARETSFYLSTLAYTKVELIAKVIRSHWAIENNLHWSLDVLFREDSSAIHAGNAPENMGLLRRFALNCHKKRTDVKRSLRKKAFACLLDTDDLLATLAVGIP